MTNNEINQTALQVFWDKISLKLSFEQIDEFVPLFYQAKEMEKEKMTKAWKAGDGQHDKVADKLAEQWYEQTYGGNK